MALKPDSKHHLTPQSRESGTDEFENIIYIPQKIHDAIHLLYGNMVLGEKVEFLQAFNQLARQNEELDGGDIHRLRQQIKQGKMPWLKGAAE